MRKVLFAGVTLALVMGTISAQAQTPTWTEDVAPLMENKCMNCHRPGEVAPMSLLTYDEAQPWARSIRLMVQDRIMPPWHATPEYGDFGNNRRMTIRQIQTVVDWVEGGTPHPIWKNNWTTMLGVGVDLRRSRTAPPSTPAPTPTSF